MLQYWWVWGELKLWPISWACGVWNSRLWAGALPCGGAGQDTHALLACWHAVGLAQLHWHVHAHHHDYVPDQALWSVRLQG